MKSQLAVIYSSLIALAILAGWIQGRSPQIPQTKPSPASVPQAKAIELQLNDSKDLKLEWAAADSLARKELLLDAWKARDPKGLLQFLRSLPPVSLLNQHKLEYDALLAWAEIDPMAAYQFSSQHDDEYSASDVMLQSWLDRNLDMGLQMMSSRAERNGMSHGDYKWIEKNPALVCERLGTMAPNICRDVYLEQASRIWATKNPQDALAFALSLPDKNAAIALNGIIHSQASAEAAKLVQQIDRPELASQMIWALMTKWGREDSGAAITWAAENLPPGGLERAMGSLASNVLSYNEYTSQQTMEQLLPSLPPAAWNALAESNSYELAIRLVGVAPDWALPSLIQPLKGDLDLMSDPTKTPAWTTNLNPERTAALIRIHQGQPK